MTTPVSSTAAAAAPAPGAADRKPPAIRLAGVTKTFGSTTVVQPVDLTIGDNEFFSILGPSGCGKTTLMRMIAGFETPTGGSIELDGHGLLSYRGYGAGYCGYGADCRNGRRGPADPRGSMLRR